jgi:transcriptional regulator with PAS, ATPase and Fis domain
LFEPVLRSTAMKRADAILRQVAGKDVVITLVGESGTGKEVLARRAHELSPRRAGPFVPINCAAIPETLFESELFGHERGAFTGATERVLGKVEAASGGTLFLDEIGELPLAMQAKLLRFLENRRFSRVGGTTKIEADVRLVCATLKPIEDEVAAGRFRADLFYRIQGISLRVPPLRERAADLPSLVEQLVAQACARHGAEAPKLPRAIRQLLASHSWPGNVRELRNTIDMLVLLRGGRVVRRSDLPSAVLRGAAGRPREGEDEAQLLVSLDRPLDAIVEQVIDAVLEAERGNRTRAAERLGISVRTIQRQHGPRKSRSGARARRVD